MENIHEKIHGKIKVNNENQSSPTKKENTFEAKITTLNGAEEMEEEKNQKRKHIQIFKNENKIYPTFESKVANCKRKLATFKNGASYTYIPKNLREIINTILHS